jgi:alpha-L-rhamnosidase
MDTRVRGLAAVLLAGAAWCGAGTIAPYDLRCEYLNNPRGIDIARPRLAWRLAATSGATNRIQTAYRILVASSTNALAADNGDRWDSGKVASAATIHIPYGGAALRCGDVCVWKVQCWDNEDAPSAWSAPASWSMGPMSTTDWAGAAWIGDMTNVGELLAAQWTWVEDGAAAPAADGVAVARVTVAPDSSDLTTAPRTLTLYGDILYDANGNTVETPPLAVYGSTAMAGPTYVAPSDPWFRKTVVLTSAPVRATAYVGSIGYHELHANGAKVGDTVLMPAISDLSQRVLYVTYDLTPHLSVGTNVLGLWTSAGWGQFKWDAYDWFNVAYAPLVIARVDLVLANGQTNTLVTDTSWKTRASNRSHRGNWTFQNFGGETIVASNDLPQWAARTLDDSTWRAAVVTTSPVALTSCMAPPNRTQEMIRAVAVDRWTPGGAYRVNMGRNFTGWLAIALTGAPGASIKIHSSERVNVTTSYNQISEYIIGPAGTGTFTHQFNYCAGQYVTLIGLNYPPQTNDVTGWVVSTANEPAGSFRCSNPLLNQIYDTTMRTFDSLALGGYVVDCPHRERFGYGGDAHATMEPGMDNYDLSAFYTKWLRDWRDVQSPSGYLPTTAPTYFGDGGPGWGGICSTLPWEMYVRYGDTQILGRMYATMTNWLGFLNANTASNILQVYTNAQFKNVWIGEVRWPNELPVAIAQTSTPTRFFNNCYYTYNLRIASNIAVVLGHTGDAATFGARADAVAAATHAAFYDTGNDTYPTFTNSFQPYYAFPLFARVTPPGLQSTVVQRLVAAILTNSNAHLDTGILGTYFLIKTLEQLGRNDLVYLIASQTNFPGWGEMLAAGGTTFWEQWGGYPLNMTRLHSSYLAIGGWLNEVIAGIQPDPRGPGYQRILIKPMAVGNLAWASGTYHSARGTISNAWLIADNIITLSATVPPNTLATICVPTNRTGACVTYTVGSGSHTFMQWFDWPVPEPTAVLLAAVMAGLALRRRSRILPRTTPTTRSAAVLDKE